MQAFFAAAERELGPVSLPVANAGVFPNCPVRDMPVEEWDRAVETNLRGTFLTCQEAARRMIAGGRPGKIITMASGAYASARLGGSHYCASKAGVVMFTKTLAMELAAQGINVNCIAPGYIDPGRTTRARIRTFKMQCCATFLGDGSGRQRKLRSPPCSWRRRRRPT